MVNEESNPEAMVFAADGSSVTAQAIAGFGTHYSEHVEGKIKGKENLWVCFIVALLVIITIFLGCPAVHQYSYEGVKRALGSEVILSSQQAIVVYFITKSVSLLLLVSLLAWVIKMYNHVRRLKIVYKDKVLMAQTFETILAAGSDPSSRELAKESAIPRLFVSSLDEVESSRQNLSIDQVIELSKLYKSSK